MEPVLLFREEDKINSEVQTLKKFVPVFQGVYDAIVELGFTPTLPEINRLLSLTNPNDFNVAKEYILDKMTRAAMPHIVNGITYPYSEVKKLMTLPNISGLTAELTKGVGDSVTALKVTHHPNFRFEPKLDLLTIVDGKVTLQADAEQKIEAIYSHYTQTDASATLAGDLQKLCDALNDLDAKHNDWYKKYLPFSHTDSFNHRVSELRGIAISEGKKFIVSPTAIRKFEQVGSINFS